MPYWEKKPKQLQGYTGDYYSLNYNVVQQWRVTQNNPLTGVSLQHYEMLWSLSIYNISWPRSLSSERKLKKGKGWKLCWMSNLKIHPNKNTCLPIKKIPPPQDPKSTPYHFPPAPRKREQHCRNTNLAAFHQMLFR